MIDPDRPIAPEPELMAKMFPFAGGALEAMPKIHVCNSCRKSSLTVVRTDCLDGRESCLCPMTMQTSNRQK